MRARFANIIMVVLFCGLLFWQLSSIVHDPVTCFWIVIDILFIAVNVAKLVEKS
jgi:hypothetical protein